MVDILPHRNIKQRKAIRDEYQDLYDEVSVAIILHAVLIHALHNVTLFIQDLLVHSNQKMSWQAAPLKHAMAALIMSPHQYDAMTLRDAIKGPGTNEKKLNEILTTRNKQVSSFRPIFSVAIPFTPYHFSGPR